MSAARPIARNKVALVHVAKARLALSDDEYRDILRHVAGVESSKELDEFGFELLMEHLRKLGFESDFQARSWGMRPGFATDRQVELIRHLWREYTDDAGTDIQLGKWLHRFFGVSALRFVTSGQAARIIPALKAMKARTGRDDG